MITRTLKLLQGLIDGSGPLPPPHPQKLCFTKDVRALRAIAAVVSHHLQADRLEMTDVELRHLLYKMACYVNRKKHQDKRALYTVIERVWPAIALALRHHPAWLTSNGGVGWALAQHWQWMQRLNTHLRSSAVKPQPVAEVAWNPPLVIVELTNAAHVHAEGVALGHCMAWSINHEVSRQRGFPPADSLEALECLTYAVKIRSGEMRLFSLRDQAGKSLVSLAYRVRRKEISEMRAREGLQLGTHIGGWTLFQCAMFRALSTVVDVERAYHAWGACLRDCTGNRWCEKHVDFIDEGGFLAPPSGVIVDRGFDFEAHEEWRRRSLAAMGAEQEVNEI